MVNEPTNNDGKEEEDTTKSQFQWTVTNISSCTTIRENCLKKLDLLKSEENSLQNGSESQKLKDLELASEFIRNRLLPISKVNGGSKNENEKASSSTSSSTSSSASSSASSSTSKSTSKSSTAWTGYDNKAQLMVSFRQ